MSQEGYNFCFWRTSVALQKGHIKGKLQINSYKTFFLPLVYSYLYLYIQSTENGLAYHKYTFYISQRISRTLFLNIFEVLNISLRKIHMNRTCSIQFLCAPGPSVWSPMILVLAWRSFTILRRFIKEFSKE